MGQESPQEDIDLNSKANDSIANDSIANDSIANDSIANRTTPHVVIDEEESRWLQSEIERCQALSEHISYIQVELRELRSLLAQRYRPSLESQVQRLSIERDEILISWGQSLLGLCEGGAQLDLRSPTGDLVTLYSAIRPLHSSEVIYPSSHVSSVDPHHESASDNARILGQREDKLELSAPFNDSLSNHKRSHQDVMISSEVVSSEVVSSEVVSSSEQSDDLPTTPLKEGSAHLEEEEDPGIAEAQTVSLTQFSLDELRQQMLSPKGWNSADKDPSTEATSDDDGIELAIEIVKRLGRPRQFSSDQLKEHLIELESEVDCCQSWNIFEQDIQHAVVTLVTSRLRSIQDHIGDSPFDQDRIAKMFRRLTRFSSDFRPGFIHGLSREKVPEFDTWRNDEVKAWQRLEELLSIKPVLPTLSPERAEKIEHLKSLLIREEETPDFSNALRAAVTDCLNSGFNQESPHLVKVLESHLSHLSGKRFKKLRLAATSPRL